MPEVATDWVQPDEIHTRERMSLRTGHHVGGHNAFNIGTPIDYDTEFIPECVTPLYDDSYAISRDADQQAASMLSKRWLTTPQFALGFPDRLDLASYSALMLVTGSVSHLQDFDPIAWMNAKQAEVIAAWLIAHPTLDTFHVEWEVEGSGPFGSIANREIELVHDVLDLKQYSRGGSEITATDAACDDLGVYPIPVAAHDTEDTEYDPDDSTYIASQVIDGDFGLPPDSWYAAEYEDRAGQDTVRDTVTTNLVGGFEGPPLVVATADSSATAAIDDAWWETNAWPARAFSGGYTSRGIPVVIGWDWLFNGAPDSPGAPMEADIDVRSSAELYFVCDWTPPRYRIVYTVDVLPAVRQYPRDDSLGLGSATRLYPPPKRHRLAGGYQ